MTIEMDFAAWSNENNVMAAVQKAFQGGPISSILGAIGITNPNLGQLPFVLKFL